MNNPHDREDYRVVWVGKQSPSILHEDAFTNYEKAISLFADIKPHCKSVVLYDMAAGRRLGQYNLSGFADYDPQV